MSSEQRQAPGARPSSDPARARRPYSRPELEQYGSLRELTRAFAFDVAGDALATSFVN